jgi:hypothetical protein
VTAKFFEITYKNKSSGWISIKTGRWYRPGDCPEDESQGCFPFGVACADGVLARQSLQDQKHKLDEIKRVIRNPKKKPRQP